MLGLKKQDKKILVFMLCLKELKGIGSKTICKLYKQNEQLLKETEILDANFADSLNNATLSKALKKLEFMWEELENKAYDILELANSKDIKALCPSMRAYPKRLLINENFPPILFCQGDESILNSEKMVAIVGTREPFEYSARIGKRLAEKFAEDGYVIVSGLALGCDSLGHEGALDAHGKTIAVLPTPIGSPVYPQENQDLANRILKNGGALVSEYPPGIKLEGRQLVSNLIARDEWQPGLSDGLVVIESSLDGGTRYAVNHAKKTGTPLAVIDYRVRENIDFYNDKNFGLNADAIKRGYAAPIYMPETIQNFERCMAKYRQLTSPTTKP